MITLGRCGNTYHLLGQSADFFNELACGFNIGDDILLCEAVSIIVVSSLSHAEKLMIEFSNLCIENAGFYKDHPK